MPEPGVSALRVRGRWFRHGHLGSPPLPTREPPPDNRWQRGEIVDALYLADAEATAWAEWYRHLAELMIPPLAQMPRELWTWRVGVEVADLSTPERLAELGLAPPSPGRHTWLDYQHAGERLAQEGWAGLIAQQTHYASVEEGMSHIDATLAERGHRGALAADAGRHSDLMDRIRATSNTAVAVTTRLASGHSPYTNLEKKAANRALNALADASIVIRPGGRGSWALADPLFAAYVRHEISAGWRA